MRILLTFLFSFFLTNVTYSQIITCTVNNGQVDLLFKKEGNNAYKRKFGRWQNYCTGQYYKLTVNEDNIICEIEKHKDYSEQIIVIDLLGKQFINESDGIATVVGPCKF